MQTRKSAQSIPSKIVSKSNHKYIYKKTLISTKFEWLNKYLSTTQLKPLTIKNSNLQSRKNRHNSTSNLINQTNFIKNKQNFNKLKTQSAGSTSFIENNLIDMANSLQLLQQININTQTLKQRCKGSNVLVMVRDFQGNLKQKFQKEKKMKINKTKYSDNFFTSSKKQLSPHIIDKSKIEKNQQNTPPSLINRQNCNLTQIKERKKRKLFMKTPQSQLSYIFRRKKNLQDFKVEPWKLDNQQEQDMVKF